MQLARELARRSAALRFEDLPADAVHWAKIGILDTVGVTLAGSGEPCAQIVRKLAGNGGQSLVFGTPERTNALDEPPFEAYATTCGITFTFGGLRIDPASGQVLDLIRQPIAGLYAAGEMVGGLFYFNYPGGSGLCAGAVFGKIAGNAAGAFTRAR